MNKNSWKYLVPCLAMALCSVAFTSCSDDDEGGSTPQGPTATYAGKLPTKVGSYIYQYDEKGRCTKVSTSYYDLLEIDYSKGIITMDDGEQEMKITFNGNGYITKMSGSWNYEDEYESESGSGTTTFKYNGDGNLTSVTATSKGKYSYDGEKGSFSGTSKTTCKWSGGDLISATWKYEEKAGGYTSWEKEEYTIAYNGTLDNKTRQYPMALSDLFGDDSYMLAAVGMFGKGPAHLPETITCKYSADDDNGSTYTSDVEYGLNPDGTIDWEKFEYDTYYYSYSAYSSGDDEATPAAKMTKAMQAGQKKLRVRDFFMPKRNRK